MKTNTTDGLLIVVDGIDGAGKTTQVEALAAALTDAGESVLVSKEPTAGPWGAKVRDSATTGRLSFDEELEAFIKDREEHLAQKVLPALNDGAVVILDRYFYSTIAYQGIRTDDLDGLQARVRESVVEPDAVFILDIDARIAALRIEDRDGEPNQFEGLDEQVRIRELFHCLCEQDPLLQMVDGARSAQAVHGAIVGSLIDGALKAKRCAKSYGCDDVVNCGYRMTDGCEWWRLRSRLLGGQGGH